MGAYYKADLPAEKINLVGAFCERPRANVVRPYNKRTESNLCPFSHALLARYSVLHLLGVLSGGDKPSSGRKVARGA